MPKRLPVVNLQCSICGYGEQCRNWEQIRETMERINEHYIKEHASPRGVMIPRLEKVL